MGTALEEDDWNTTLQLITAPPTSSSTDKVSSMLDPYSPSTPCVPCSAARLCQVPAAVAAVHHQPGTLLQGLHAPSRGAVRPALPPHVRLRVAHPSCKMATERQRCASPPQQHNNTAVQHDYARGRHHLQQDQRHGTSLHTIRRKRQNSIPTAVCLGPDCTPPFLKLQLLMFRFR